MQYVNVNGSANSNLLGTIGWGRDTLDRAIYTTEGSVQRATAEISLPVFDMRYYKLDYLQQWFHPLSKDLNLMLHGEAGVAGGYGNNDLPFFKNFYAGGPGSVLGYDSNSLGPRDSTDAVLGGPRRVLGGAEVLAPFPGMGNEKSVRLSGFI